MDVVKTADGSMSFELVKRLSGGAEGMVFLTDQRNIVAKIYHKGVITPLRWAKLKKLSELGINGKASAFRVSCCISRMCRWVIP